MQETNFHILPQTRQLRALHTIIRDKNASLNDFVFYSQRIMRMLLEAALDLLPFEEHKVTTPVGATYQGLRFCSNICGVSVIRAGESMEQPLRELCGAIPIGKILIQRDKTTKLPHLFYANLPDDIASKYVLLLEPMLATAGSAKVAVRVLLEKGVPEKNIVLVNFLTVPKAIETICATYPQLQLITSSVEQELNHNAYMVPGIGDFGDRFFGANALSLF